jgi:gluconokinase
MDWDFERPNIVVMGASGCGKSALGQVLATRFGWPFIEGDDLHPPRNLAKMRAGVALTDDDRWPWLDAIGTQLSEASGGAVASCSALRKTYRDRLRAAAARPILFVWLHAARELLKHRLIERKGHFMPALLLDSQLATLEPPGDDEWCVGLSASTDLEQLVLQVENFFYARSA